MANEAVIIELHGNGGDPVRYTIADGSAGSDVEKGTLMKITNPRTIIATAADNDPFAGVLAAEKVGGDGSTTATVYTKGIFDILCTAAAVAAGERVSIGAANSVSKVGAADLLFADVGIALETGNASVDAVLIGSGL